MYNLFCSANSFHTILPNTNCNKLVQPASEPCEQNKRHLLEASNKPVTLITLELKGIREFSLCLLLYGKIMKLAY